MESATSQHINTCTHTQTPMGTKTISIMDDAYELLVSSKHKEESFSDVIRRTFTHTRPKITEVMGLGNFQSAKEREELRKTVESVRREWGTALVKRTRS